MLVSNPLLPCVAVSYDSPTFSDLRYFLKSDHGIDLGRVEPNDLTNNPDQQYINLITDMSKRREVSDQLDQYGLLRFSYIHPTTTIIDFGTQIENGLFMYPNAVIYSNTQIGRDVLVHFGSAIAHNVKIGRGTYISGGAIIAGTTTIGEFCWFGLHSAVSDRVTLTDNVIVGAHTFIRKSISKPGTYSESHRVTRCDSISAELIKKC